MMAVTMSGCLEDIQDGNDGTQDPGTSSGNEVVGSDSEGNPVRAGDDLGELTYSDEDEVSAVLTQPDCLNDGGVANTYGWRIPSKNADGIPWKADRLTVTVTGSETAVDLDVVLNKDGREIGRASETGPDQEESVTVTVQDVSPGSVQIVVRVCTTAAQATYTIEGVARMVATSQETATSTGGSDASSSSGDVQVEQKTDGDGDTYYEARRQDTFTASLTGATGTADISTGAGYITYTGGGGDDYRLVATLKARGDSEQEARARLAEMYVDHTATDGPAVLLEAHGRPGGDGQWNKKQIDLVFDAPSRIDWTTFEASSAAGYVRVDTVTGTTVGVHTSAGYVQIDDVEADDLSGTTSAGYIQVRGSRAGDLRLSSSAGYVDAIMEASTQSGSWDVDASAGSIDLRVKETSSIGYDVDARTSAGSVTFDFDDVQQTSSNCQYASCHREGRTNGYESRTIKVSLDLDTSAGSITAGS